MNFFKKYVIFPQILLQSIAPHSGFLSATKSRNIRRISKRYETGRPYCRAAVGQEWGLSHRCGFPGRWRRDGVLFLRPAETTGKSVWYLRFQGPISLQRPRKSRLRQGHQETSPSAWAAGLMVLSALTAGKHKTAPRSILFTQSTMYHPQLDRQRLYLPTAYCPCNL